MNLTEPEILAPEISNPEIDFALEKLERGGAEIISRDELRQKLLKSTKNQEPLRIKLGLDPTAPDIHLGFAVVLRKLRLFQDLGHEAHLIIGDFTAQIGDPSGKSKTRPQLTREQVQQNAQTYKEQLFKILDESKTVVHFNGDWLGKMSFADVVRLTSKYTVAQMLEREDFANRLAQQKPVALHEILYPLCQGQDSVEIKADVELGGTDQRFNNLVGRELQRASGQEPQVVMLMPILVGLDGTQKMSKSLGNYVGISEAAGEMFGKIMSLPDAAMETYFTLCTQIPAAEIAALLQGHPMDAKKRLGREIVAQYHGEEAAADAQNAFEKQFSRNEVPEEMPEVTIASEEISAAELLKACFGLTGGEAKRMILQGAVSIDGQKIEAPTQRITPQNGLTIKMGRKWARLKI
ncbi:tyrosine--tRNA ligase [Abditibacterium utsteinense]|nr:tyrosine--tRNA ligase [Abditibacterium utsteinense]